MGKTLYCDINIFQDFEDFNQANESDYLYEFLKLPIPEQVC